MYCTDPIVHEINKENELEWSNFASNRKASAIASPEHIEHLKRAWEEYMYINENGHYWNFFNNTSNLNISQIPHWLQVFPRCSHLPKMSKRGQGLWDLAH